MAGGDPRAMHRIFYFDMAKEMVKELPRPDYEIDDHAGGTYSSLDLGVLRGELYVFRSRANICVVEAWVLKDHDDGGDKESSSWSKAFVIPPFVIPPRYGGGGGGGGSDSYHVRPMCFSYNGNKLGLTRRRPWRGRDLYLYDTRRAELKKITLPEEQKPARGTLVFYASLSISLIVSYIWLCL